MTRRVDERPQASRRRGASIAVPLVFAVAAVAGCSADPAATAPPTSAPGSSSYASTSFLVPFDVTPPTWLPPEPIADESRFVTWETTDATRAVRFLDPVSLYRPGDSQPTPIPDDYLPYLLSQRDQGATFGDVAETVVGGRPASVVTATVDDPLDGSLGCPDEGMAADDCFGLQPDLVLRIAVVDLGADTLLIWLRNARDADAGDVETDARGFDEMLASLTFSDRSPQAATSAVGAATLLDGTWATSYTYEELASGPLLDQEELNDENWGDFTMTFDRGAVELTTVNPDVSGSATGTYEVDGDLLVIKVGVAERFAMRWQIDGDELTFVRDESLGVCPTNFIIKPWVRQP